MPTSPTETYQERLRELEREILAFRRLLGEERASLPTSPFEALEIVVGELVFLVPAVKVTEVLPMLWCRPIPETPDWVLGDFIYGDRNVPAIHLRQRLGLGSGLVSATHKLIVIEEHGQCLALMVDDIGNLITVAPNDVKPLTEGIPYSAFILGHVRVDKDTKLLLALDRVCRDVVLEDHATL